MAEVETKYDVDEQSDEELNECIISASGDDRRRCITESPNKNDAIISCFGSIESQYIPDSTLREKETTHGTGTVIHIDDEDQIYVLTAAHNVRGVERECVNCLCKTLKSSCPDRNCNGITKKTKTLISPGDIYFTRRSYDKSDKYEEGESIETYKVETYKLPPQYETFADCRSGYDVAIIILSCHDAGGISLYQENCRNIQLIQDKDFGGKKCVKFIYGYPGDRCKVQNGKKYYYIHGHGTSKLDKKNKFSVAVYSRSGKEYIINEGIDTSVGQSGSVIYSYDNKNKNKFLVYGVHSGGSQKKKENYGTYLNQHVVAWVNDNYPMIKIKKAGFKVHVAIDFGTDGLGLAYAINNEVFIHSMWSLSDKYSDTVKPKTIILLDKNTLETECVGMDAKYMYKTGKNMKNTHLLFERFKMALYQKELKKSLDDEKNSDEQKEVIMLTDAGGNKLPAEKVFVAAFKYLQKEAKEFLDQKALREKKKFKFLKKGSLRDEEIQWIITVPAIWTDEAKDKMQKWAVEAGLVNENVKDQCKIVYEPDCASLSIQYEIHDRNKQNKLSVEDMVDVKKQYKEFDADITKNILKQNNFVKGERYCLVDAGGGTVDIACHEIIDEFSVKEILHPSGDKWGSTYIDDKYKQLLVKMFGAEWMDEFREKQPNVYVDVVHNFQKAKERFFEKRRLKEHNVLLPKKFLQFLEQKANDGEDSSDSDDDINQETTTAIIRGRMQTVSLKTFYDEFDFGDGLDGGLSSWLVFIGFKNNALKKMINVLKTMPAKIKEMYDLEIALMKKFIHNRDNPNWIDVFEQQMKMRGISNDDWLRFRKCAKQMTEIKYADDDEDSLSKMINKHKYDLSSVRDKNKAGLIQLEDEYLVINQLIWQQMFDSVMEPTMQHIKELLKHKLLANGQCKYLCLVGGFACSKYFQFKMENEFGKASKYGMKFIVPSTPDLSVVQGAAYFGIRQDYIKARVLKYTYGCRCKIEETLAIQNNVPKEHIEKYKVYDENSGKYFVRKCVHVIARKNETIAIGDIKKYLTQRKDYDTPYATMRIFVSDMEYPTIMNDGKTIAELKIDFDEENDKKELNIDAEFHFSDTMIKIFAYKPNTKNKKQEIELTYEQNTKNKKRKRKPTATKSPKIVASKTCKLCCDCGNSVDSMDGKFYVGDGNWYCNKCWEFY